MVSVPAEQDRLPAEHIQWRRKRTLRAGPNLAEENWRRTAVTTRLGMIVERWCVQAKMTNFDPPDLRRRPLRWFAVLCPTPHNMSRVYETWLTTIGLNQMLNRFRRFESATQVRQSTLLENACQIVFLPRKDMALQSLLIRPNAQK